MKIERVSRAARNRRNPHNKCNSRSAPSAYLARKHNGKISVLRSVSLYFVQ